MSVSAAADGNVQEALVKLAEFAVLDPRRAETLETEPGLASIHADVRQFLFRLASSAQMDAESRLGQATRFLQAAGSKELPGQEMKPEIVILIAGRLLEAGGYANCVRSAELSQMTINLYGGAPTPATLSLTDPRSIAIGSAHDNLGLRNKWMPRIRKLWLRAPLLVLLLVWLAVGLVAGSVSALLRTCWPQMWPESLVAVGFEIWEVGFPCSGAVRVLCEGTESGSRKVEHWPRPPSPAMAWLNRNLPAPQVQVSNRTASRLFSISHAQLKPEGDAQRIGEYGIAL